MWWFLHCPASAVRIDQHSDNSHIHQFYTLFFLKNTLAETYRCFNSTFERQMFLTLAPEMLPVSLLPWCTLKPIHFQHHMKLTQFPWTAFKIPTVELSPSLHVPYNTTFNPYLSLTALTTSACLHFHPCILEILNCGAKVSSRIWITNTQTLILSSFLHVTPVTCIYSAPSLTTCEFLINHFHTNLVSKRNSCTVSLAT